MNEEQAREIAIKILDEFEDLLAAKDIKIPSDDREGRQEEACLYGTEYYELEDAIVGILVEETDWDAGSQPSGCRANRTIRQPSQLKKPGRDGRDGRGR